jgi:alkylhydroperoxidase/carboxymuconolactone decarboxylase family protein YurZ
LSLGASDRRLLRLFVACVLGRWDEVRRSRREVQPGEPDRRWREALLQVHLFAGVPRQVEAAGVLEQEGGLGPPDDDEVEGRGGDAQTSRGRALFERIYADDSTAVRAMLARGHPELEHWVLEHAYGRVLSRPGLSADRRELLAVAALAVLGQDRQLASHARGALRCGATREELGETLETIRDLVDPSHASRIDEALRLAAKIA